MNYYIYCKDKNMAREHLDALKEYEKRLSPYCKIQCFYGKKHFIPEHFSANNHQILLITKGLSTDSSPDFAEKIKKMEVSGQTNVHIYIGYDQKELIDAFSLEKITTFQTISITGFDLSNQILCILFIEQLYRGYTIIQGKTYHK